MNSNNKGISLLIFCFLLLFLSSSLLMWIYLSNLALSKNILRTQCFIINEDLQKVIAQSTDKLFKLNPLAETLRIRRKYIELQLMAALATGQASLVATFSLQLKLVIEQQKKLDQLQKILIQTAQIQMKSHIVKKLNRIQNYYKNLQNTWHVFGLLENSILITKWPLLPVRPDYASELAPKYVYSFQYLEDRKLILNLQNIMSRWIIKQKNQSSTFTCEASYLRTNIKFVPQIRMVKSFSSF